MATLLDVTHEIRIDHDNVRDLYTRFKGATDKAEKWAIANTLVREMAIHSDAEELSVYNEYARLGLGDTAEHNKEEHAEVKRLVYDADTKNFDSPEYDDVMTRAYTGFIEHAKEEEDQQFDKLKAKLTPEENDKIARAFLKARTMAPSRPHPMAPQSGGILQTAAGMQASLHDKVRVLDPHHRGPLLIGAAGR